MINVSDALGDRIVSRRCALRLPTLIGSLLLPSARLDQLVSTELTMASLCGWKVLSVEKY
jgi:hypothetical protein